MAFDPQPEGFQPLGDLPGIECATAEPRLRSNCTRALWMKERFTAKALFTP